MYFILYKKKKNAIIFLGYLIFPRFMESEVELHDAVEELHVVATVPNLYPILIEMGTVKTLLSLLSHENTDISIAVVDLLQVGLLDPFLSIWNNNLKLQEKKLTMKFIFDLLCSFLSLYKICCEDVEMYKITSPYI
ncbi:hypothetical protein Avbf_03648 [Armadillidium vulgare]|nr:hypothetical protein Avbf_03648 [Armadillidium vulgare]